MTPRFVLSLIAVGAIGALTPHSTSIPRPIGTTSHAASSVALDWTAEPYLRASSWEATVALATAYVGPDVHGVIHDDWRLPTIEELQAAVTDSDPDTFGQTDPNGNHWSFWTSKSQGIWAYGVKVVSGPDGYPITALSGQKLKHTKTSMLLAKFVRP